MTRRSLPASVSRSGGRESDRSTAVSRSATEILSDAVRVQIHGVRQLADTHRARGPLKHREEPSPADPGQDAVALLWRSHGLHFAL
jgi:hypothetical protein